MLQLRYFLIVLILIKFIWPTAYARRWYSSIDPQFKCERALIVSKLSRYEFERYRAPSLNAAQLEDVLRRRGSDYELLLRHHHIHKACEAAVETALKARGIETRIVNRCVVH